LLRWHSPPFPPSPSLTLTADELTWYSPLHSASPASKRNLKPSPIAANPHQAAQYPPSSELPSLQSATTAAHNSFPTASAQPSASGNARKRKSVSLAQPLDQMATPVAASGSQTANATTAPSADSEAAAQEPRPKKSRTNTPWTPAEEQRLKQMRDAGNSWSEIAKVEEHQPTPFDPDPPAALAVSCSDTSWLTISSARLFRSGQKAA
jgi:hypothetical protein